MQKMAPSLGNPSSSFFSKFFSLLLLVLLHVGCFFFAPTAGDQNRRVKRRKHSSFSWSSLKRIFSPKTQKIRTQTRPATPARSSQQSISTLIQSEIKRSGSLPEFEISSDQPFFPLRNDIFPCTNCGEIFQKQQSLEQHQSTKHAVTELVDGDGGKNIVRMIFEMGWRSRNRKSPNMIRILKIHNSQTILSKFEDYRESVKAKAAINAVRRQDERCIADGNELLRFHCSTFVCDLGLNGNSSVCSQQFCNICGIIKSGFSPKLDGISTFSSTLRAHSAVPEEIEEEFKFLNVKRAMLVCRVVAGRVGCDAEEADKDGGGFDSVVGRSGSGACTRLDEEELLVFNPRAVLPCFVIVYTA